MKNFKLIGLTILQVFKQICRLPKSIAAAIRYRREDMAHAKFEAERLDRIRHPDKYLGK